MKETVNVKDHKGRYKKLVIDGDKMYFGKEVFKFSIKKLLHLAYLYDLRPTRNNKEEAKE